VIIGGLVAEALPFDIRLDDPFNPKGAIVVGAFLFGGILTLTLLSAFLVSRVSLGDLGWRRPSGSGLGLAGGLALAISLAAIAVTVVLSLAAPQRDPMLGFGFSLTLVFFTAVGALVAPVAEEIAFRGYLYAGLRTVMAMVPAALISGFLFGAAHLASGEAIATIAAITALGICWAVLREKTGSIVPGMALHGALNGAALVGVTGQPLLCLALFGVVLAVCALACVRPGV
jgi:membrane protease YdiL (CAAX protease family)